MIYIKPFLFTRGLNGLFSDIVHRDLKLENILLSQPVGNELLNIKVGFRNVTMYIVT